MGIEFINIVFGWILLKSRILNVNFINIFCVLVQKEMDSEVKLEKFGFKFQIYYFLVMKFQVII